MSIGKEKWTCFFEIINSLLEGHTAAHAAHIAPHVINAADTILKGHAHVAHGVHSAHAATHQSFEKQLEQWVMEHAKDRLKDEIRDKVLDYLVEKTDLRPAQKLYLKKAAQWIVEGVTINTVEEMIKMIACEEEDECFICGFRGKTNRGLHVHMTKMHAKGKQ